MSYGQGSLTQDQRNGRWLARYRGADGRQHSKTFERKTDARNFLAAMQTDKLRGVWIDPAGAQVLFSDWAQEWFRGRHGLGPATRARDESLLRNHIMPMFARMPLGRIGPLDVRSWINDLVSAGLSPRTVQSCFTVLGSILRSAHAAKLIAEVPLAKGVVDLPRAQRKRERFLTELELEHLASQFDGHYKPLIYTAAYTGCRWQEVSGLKRCFLDLDGAKLHVRGVFERVGGGLSYRECPKSDAGRRTISLPRFLATMLTDYLAVLDTQEWVFTVPAGGTLRESNFRRVWRGAVSRAGLEPLTFHDLRHTHAAWLIRDGVQPLALQRRLGHRDIRTTMNVYGHLFPNFEDAVVDLLERRHREASEESAKILSFLAPQRGSF